VLVNLDLPPLVVHAVDAHERRQHGVLGERGHAYQLSGNISERRIPTCPGQLRLLRSFYPKRHAPRFRGASTWRLASRSRPRGLFGSPFDSEQKGALSGMDSAGLGRVLALLQHHHVSAIAHEPLVLRTWDARDLGMLVFPSEPSSEVLLLGAGFSKALSAAMPLTDELGGEVVRLVQARSPLATDKQFSSGEFEAWLSRISEDQPDLTSAENLANRALFQQCSDALADVLSQRVEKAVEDALSRRWFHTLLGTLHARRATVVTFNQDTLVEQGVDVADLYSWDQRRWRAAQFDQPRITSSDVLDNQPPLPSTRWGYGPPQETFRLLKLHGSTNWFWHPGDLSGATTARWFLPGMLGPDQVVPDEASALRRELPGRVPLIVPPAAAKSSYYQIPLLTQLWQDARAALLASPLRLSLIGYSIPLTDLVTSGMLRETVVERSDNWTVPIDVVDPNATLVRNHLESLGVDGSHITEFESAEEFIESYERRAAHEVAAAFRNWKTEESDALILVGPSLKDGRKVIGIEVHGTEVELHLEQYNPPYASTNISPPGSPKVLSLSDLLPHLDESTSALVAVNTAAERRLVVGAAEHLAPIGAGDGRWQVLVTAEGI
jgi:hypothetical protein